MAIRFGGDYNPEQWPRETWREHAVLMRQAPVGLDGVPIGEVTLRQFDVLMFRKAPSDE